MLKPLTKTTPRLPSPHPVVVMNVSVGSVEMLSVAFVSVGQLTVDGGAGELFQLFKLQIAIVFDDETEVFTYI